VKNSKYPLEYRGKFCPTFDISGLEFFLPSEVCGLGVLLSSSYEIRKIYSISSSYDRLKYIEIEI